MPHPESIHTVKSRKGFRTRRALLDAAFELIADHGITHLTIAAISEAVGLTRSSAYNHFPDLSAVLDAVSEDVLDRIGEMSGVRAETRMRGLSLTTERLKFVLSLSSRHPKIARVLSELYLHHDPSAAAIERRIRADIHVDIGDNRLRLRKRETANYARIVVASAMATLRYRTLFPDKRISNATVLRLLLDPVRPAGES
ncbi:MAG: TetR/AcrR family transcriptional regulator [Pseudomonadota bacterium]